MTGGMRVVVRGTALVLWSVVLPAVTTLALYAGPEWLRARLVQGYFRGVLFIMGIRVMVSGDKPCPPPCLLAVNHLSYLDVFTLGALLPLRFTPKKEVAGWPVIGFFTNLTRAIYIDRSRHAARKGAEAVAAALAEGSRVVLFPEGTTGSGVRILPFKSSLFALLEGSNASVQPVSIVYTRVNGLPVTHHDLPRLAWFGDMDLVPHLKRMLAFTQITIAVRFHPPVSAEGMDRKALARICEHAVNDGFFALRGAAPVHRPAPTLTSG